MAKQVYMSPAKRRLCELDAKSIAFYRRNPCIACEDLLGIQLFDAQKYMLQNSWNAAHVVWCCSRNFGKSFLISVMVLLKAILFENQEIYIVSSVGQQAKETFQKLESIVMRSGNVASSIESLSDIAEKETVKTPTNKTGFSHNTSGFSVTFYNGSTIETINSTPSNARSRRCTMVVADEASYCATELLVVVEAFATQNTDFITSTNADYSASTRPRKCPTQIIYASSQDTTDKLFYQHYKNFAKKMLAGDRNYFVCDMTCDVAIHTYMNGEPYLPLLSEDKVQAALAANKNKALREYFNVPTADLDSGAIVRWATIRRNEAFQLPQVGYDPKYKIALAFDPARTGDNSIVGAMRIYEDPENGLCGDIVNCFNMVDIATKAKYKLDSNRQLDLLRETLVRYNGPNPDYEFIDSLSIDQGAGGGGVSTYADNLLNDWTDKYGRTHRGLIDNSAPIYEGYNKRYPNAINKLRLVNPKKLRTQMVEEFIELVELGVLRFPREYDGSDYVQILKQSKDGEEEFESYELSSDEIQALSQIDLMKAEITSIQKTTNSENTTVTYALSKEKERRMHDDRFYVAILLAHRLYELRRGKIVEDHRKQIKPTEAIMFKKPILPFRR